MRAIVCCVIVCLLSACPLRADENVVDLPRQSAPPKHYLVEMSCDADDRDAVTGTLRTALALREDQSGVTLFIDVAAVQVAKPSSDVQSPELQRETDRLFGKLRTAGVLVLICPHCAEQHGLNAKSLRPGLRFTNKEELDAERKRADEIYEYKRPEPLPAAEQKVAECRTN
jgi:sulfur relay (sulfurtransferase) complex TusBCD TusD component (DsrE family)